LLYGTTKKFLEVFGLSSIADLPTLRQIEELGGPEEEAVSLRDITRSAEPELPFPPMGEENRGD
jgi:segregation and condensation protein B